MGEKLKLRMRIVTALLGVALALVLIAACGPGTAVKTTASGDEVPSAKEARDILGDVADTPTPDIVPRPTDTAVPDPTATPEPVPTNTPEPTAIPEPTVAPTAEPESTEEPADNAGSDDRDAGADVDLVAQGEEIFQVTAGGVGCQFCHMSDATGLVGPDIRGKTAKDITDAIGGGAPDMAFLQSLTEDEIAAVAAYLATLAS